jgi:hypothetical protein
MFSKPLAIIGWLVVLPAIVGSVVNGAIQKSGDGYVVKPKVVMQSIGETVEANTQPYDKIVKPRR